MRLKPIISRIVSGPWLILSILLIFFLFGCAVETGGPVSKRPVDHIITGSNNKQAKKNVDVIKQEVETVQRGKATDKESAPGSSSPLSEKLTNNISAIRTQLHQALSGVSQLSSTRQIIIIGSVLAASLLIAVVFSAILV